MPDALLYLLLAVALIQSALLVVLFLRRSGPAAAPLTQTDLDARLLKLESLLRDESERDRRESAAASADLRKELVASLSLLGEQLGGKLRDGSDAQRLANADFALTLTRSLDTAGQKTDAAGLKTDALRAAVETRLHEFQALAQTHRDQLTSTLDTFRSQILNQLDAFGQQQLTRFHAADLKDADQHKSLREELTSLSRASTDALKADLGTRWSDFNAELTKLADAQRTSIHDLRTTVETNLKSIREDNEQRLEKMRQTVDEKLQSTLEARLGESFKLVSERLEAVQSGLGEMKSLASGVGDLKRVLTNVKTRGTWGEVLLGNLLEQVLTADQYDSNVSTTGSADRVEYAVRLPGRGDGDGVLYLPIDSKFPKEDYERLLAAQDAADPVLAAEAGKSLESSIKKFAQDICDKYIESPKTTDFAIMFLPSEGLYAEVIRRTETVDHLQRKCRVLVTGPTTLSALLNSLQMGFRTLTIQKRSSEVWDLLGAVKTEFTKYADVMAKVKKKLEEAGNTIDQAETRTRVINRKLKAVEQMDQKKTTEVFPNLLEDELTDAEA